MIGVPSCLIYVDVGFVCSSEKGGRGTAPGPFRTYVGPGAVLFRMRFICLLMMVQCSAQSRLYKPLDQLTQMLSLYLFIWIYRRTLLKS